MEASSRDWETAPEHNQHNDLSQTLGQTALATEAVELIESLDRACLPPEWYKQAACTWLDPSLFFGPLRTHPNQPAETSQERRVRETKAKAVCASCPVQPNCLNYAQIRPERFGIWGGQTPRERHQ